MTHRRLVAAAFLLASMWLGPMAVRGACAHPPQAGSSHGTGTGDRYDLSAHQTLSRVVLLIRENYVEPERIRPYEMFMAALDFIQRTVPEVLIDDTQAPARIVVSAGTVSQAFDLAGLDQLWEVTMALRDVFRFLQAHIEDPSRRQDIEYAAINGMLSTLDPHSILLKPENFDEIKLSTKGEFGGLGIVISIRDGGLTIIAPIEGTPAAQAGLRARDKIVKIGEESTVNMGLEEAVQILRGAADTKVSVSVQRKGWTEPREFVLTRAIIKIESVSSELLDGGIGYVKLKSFQGNTYDDLQAHLARLKQRNSNAPLRGLVLDMRNNPGGLLDQAILVSDRFISRGPLVITVGEGARRREVKNAHPGPDEDAYPMVVLLNGGSASASEIVAGALKNHDRAMVLGQQSFGKGSVQVLYDFKDRSALKLTIAQYLTPGDVSIQSVGIVPDVAVVPAVLEREGVHLFVDDEAPREKDLSRHLSRHMSPQAAATLATPTLKMSHLSAKERDQLDPNNTGELSRDEELATGKFEYDFETRLAHDVLVQARSHNRRTMLQQADALLQGRLAEQQAQVQARMAELGVDWQAGPLPAAAGGQAEVALALTPAGRPIRAGETATLSATVHNRGKAPLYRLYGVTQSDNPLMGNLEFAFGHVAPGERRSWDVKIKWPADMPARADRVTLQVFGAPAQGDVAAASALAPTVLARGEVQVRITEQLRPTLAFAYSLDDAAPRGNGDGLLQDGEAVRLRVTVSNLGPGVAEDITVLAKNMAHGHLFLDAGRAKLGALKPGESREATLQFRVHGPGMRTDALAPAAHDDEAPAGPEPDALARRALVPGDVLPVRLSVWDAALGAQVAQTLQLPVAAARRGQPVRSGMRARGRAAVPVFAAASASAPLLGTVPGRATLPTVQSFGSFVAVAIGRAEPGQDAAVGFVRIRDVEPGPAAARGSVAPIRKMAPTAAPELQLDLGALVAHGASYTLRGEVRHPRPLRDVFVFVGDKKVFYRPLSALVQHDGTYRYALAVPLKLKEGVSDVLVVARENDDLMARRYFSLLRQDAAERVPGARAVHEPAPAAVGP